MNPEEAFRRWHMPWKERVCEEARPFSHGTVLQSRRFPDFWEYNCLRVDRPMGAGEMVAAADRELAECAHRLVEWMIPMPRGVVSELRERGWMATPLIYMRHDGRPVLEDRHELLEVDYQAVSELRDMWHREDFGENSQTESFRAQAREVAKLADARVIAVLDGGRLAGFAQVETHDGGSEVAQVFVHPGRRGSGLGRALTARAIQVASHAAPQLWICAERDNRPRRLYERLGFSPVIETGNAILPPPRKHSNA